VIPRLGILISGRGSNMEAIVREASSGVLEGRCEIAVVVSNRRSAAGLERAAALGVPTCVVPSRGRGRDDYGQDLLAALAPFRLDYLVLAGFMLVLPPSVIRAWPKRILNIHPADTAVHRGLHGYAFAWENRLEQTFVTVHWVDEGLDTGPVIAKAPVDLKGVGDLGEVERRGLAVEHRFYSDVIRQVVTSTDSIEDSIEEV
jgi:phosphoribosylglycinamide formyltransferase 1